MQSVIITYNYRLHCLLVVTALFIGSACNKQLEVDSTRQQNEAGQWTKYEDARSGLIGMYGLFRAAIADNNAHWLWGELRNGDFLSVVRPDLKAVIEGRLNASYPVMESITNWRRFYAAIDACNLFIERVQGCMQDKRYTEAYYKVDVAQARALRAFAYFYMVRIWGDVPLIIQSHEGSFEALPRTPQSEVLAFAQQELIAAAPRLPFLYSGADPEQHFPANYYGNDSQSWLNALVNRLAAYALLAHIAAWKGQYIDVAVYTEYIVNNFQKSNLSMLSTQELVGLPGGSGGSVFDARSDNYNQLIGFPFMQNRGETTISGHIEQLTLANTTLYPMSKQLPDIYIPKDTIGSMFPSDNGNDERFGIDVRFTPPLLYDAYFENYNAAVPVFKKIRVIDGGAGATGNFSVYNSSIVFTRLEEIRLLRAEALAVLGQKEAAGEELNKVRANRGVNPYLFSSGKDLLTEIFEERRRELVGEGWRWYDLVRYNRLKRNNPAFNALIDNGGIYWPIAQEVLNRNATLEQNSYWK
jgi:hypothetical protein